MAPSGFRPAILSLLLLLGAFSSSQAQSSRPTSDLVWQREWERVMTGAKREGKVVVWGPPGAEVRKALTEGFYKSLPGIEVEYTGASGALLAPKLLAERRAKQYVVDLYLSGTTTILEGLLKGGALDPVRPALILPEVVDLAKWWQGRLDFADQAGRYNLVFSTNVKTPVAINPTLVKRDSLRSYWDLLNPKWQGKVVMKDPVSPGPGNATAAFLYAEPALGKEFMRQFFTQQKVTLSFDDRQILEWVARGQYLVAVAPSELLATGLKAKGLAVELVGAEQFKEGSYITAGFGSAALINPQPHPNAARIYLNWLLSKDGQTEWSKAAGYTSRRLDVPRDHLDPAYIPKEGVYYQPNYKEEYVRLRSEVNAFLEGVLKK